VRACTQAYQLHWSDECSINKPLKPLLSIENGDAGGAEHNGGTNNPSSPTSTCNGVTKRAALWQQLADIITPSVQKVVEFAKRIPGTKSIFYTPTKILGAPQRHRKYESRSQKRKKPELNKAEKIRQKEHARAIISKSRTRPNE